MSETEQRRGTLKTPRFPACSAEPDERITIRRYNVIIDQSVAVEKVLERSPINVPGHY